MLVTPEVLPWGALTDPTGGKTTCPWLPRNVPIHRRYGTRPKQTARGITEEMLAENCEFGGMDDYHAQVSRDDCKAVSF